MAEKKLQDTLDSLRKAVNTTIQVMVSAVETRDPYTAGHQLRSANLARAIATEILSKPTRLSEPEFSLIKEHARRGLEMLKDVESP